MKKTFTKILSVVLCAVMALGAAPLGGLVGLDLPSLFDFKAEAATDSGVWGGITWSFNTSTGVLDLSGKDTVYSPTDAWNKYRADVRTINVHEGIKSIGYNVFRNFANLTTVNLPNTLDIIGNWAFGGCTNLTKITIPNNVKEIWGRAFYNCTKLSAISLPHSLEFIDTDVFTNTAYFNNSSNWDNGVLYIGNYLIKAKTNISGSYSIKSGTVCASEEAFKGCNNLKTVVIPNGFRRISNSMFADCSSLTAVTIPNSVISIGDYAFLRCTYFSNISIPDSVSEIDSSAFYDTAYYNNSANWKNNLLYIGKHLIEAKNNITDCTIAEGTLTIAKNAFGLSNKLINLILPKSLKYMSTFCLGGCYNLLNITVDNNNNYFTTIDGVLFDKNLTTLIKYPPAKTNTTYSVPNGVQILGDDSFNYCSNLKEVILPDSLKTIADYAFSATANLALVHIPSSVTHIGERIFLAGEENFGDAAPIICSESENCQAKKYAESNGCKFKVCDGHENGIKIMSYNIYVKDGTITDLTNGKKYDCSYENRVRYIVQNVHANMPDSFGVQEISKELRNLFETYEDLNGGIIKANYTGVGDYREGNNGENSILIKGDNEASLIYYNKTKFECLESGTFWLSENGKTGSKHSKSEYPRICTYALLENKATGFTYLHVNTHIEHDHTGDDDIKSNDAAIYSSEKITEFIKYNYPDMPVVVTGDFNQTSSSTPYKNFVNAGYTDARSVYSGNTVTYPNPFKQGGEDKKPYGAKTIDHIFVNDYFKTSSYTVYNEDYTNSSKYGRLTLDYPYPSDHHPVVVTLDVVKEGKQTEVYNVGEDTYSFDNFSHLICGGHCFGMSITSAGYYIGQVSGGSNGNGIYGLKKTDAVEKPICAFQKIQGSFSINAIVAGGRYYKYDYYDVNSDWNEVVNYVKNHQYDGKGNLQIGFRINGKNGHAVNFLRYSVVNGQERIYAYDNNFPNTETYFYKDSNGDIRQAPVATFKNKKIECIALRDINKYFGSISSYNEKRYIYSEKDDIYVSGAKAYPIDCSDDSPEQVVYEIPANAELVAITPLTEDATFTYLDEEYSFEKDGEIALLSLGEETEETSVEFTTDYLADFKIKQPNVTTINYGETLVLQVEDIELPEGWRVEWSIIGNAVTMSASDDGKECRVTSTASGNVTVRATVVDENGEPVLNAEGGEIFTDINIKSNASFWQKIVSFFKNLFRINRIIY